MMQFANGNNVPIPQTFKGSDEEKAVEEKKEAAMLARVQERLERQKRNNV